MWEIIIQWLKKWGARLLLWLKKIFKKGSLSPRKERESEKNLVQGDLSMNDSLKEGSKEKEQTKEVSPKEAKKDVVSREKENDLSLSSKEKKTTPVKIMK
ncbi:MAG: hypothetical protein D6785_02185, partial [Planctomycetota bacterium]